VIGVLPWQSGWSLPGADAPFRNCSNPHNQPKNERPTMNAAPVARMTDSAESVVSRRPEYETAHAAPARTESSLQNQAEQEITPKNNAMRQTGGVRLSWRHGGINE